jgi:hypothetical protein
MVGDRLGGPRPEALTLLGQPGMGAEVVRWDRSRSAPVQEQGEFYAIAPGGPGVIVVGSFGAPDSYVPSVWLSPGR